MSLEFDSSFYLKQYPDIKEAGIDPEWHFKNYGAAEGRAPNAELLAVAKGFDADAYLSVNQDVADAIENGADLTAYKHWVLYGRFEANRPEATYNDGVPVSEPVPSLENTFNADEYLSLYPDVANANIDPLWHFKNYGAAEGRAPNAAFADAGVNGTTFDADAYLAENTDIAAAIENGANLTAYQHWVLYGQFEARPEATLTDGRTVSEALDTTSGTATTFTLTEVTTTTTIDSVTTDIEPTVDKVIYWGNASTGEGVPAEDVFGGDPLAGAMLAIIDGITADGLSDLLAKIAAITEAGIEDLLQGEGPIGENVTVVEGDSNTITIDAEGNVTIEQTPGTKAGDYTGDYQIVLNIEGADVINGQITLTAQQFSYLSDMLFDAEGNPRLFEVEEKTWPQVELKDADGELVLDADGQRILVDLKQYTTDEKTISTSEPLVLTPSQNNGGTQEQGFTTDSNNIIVAGRLDLLHQAYIDGGEGYDVLQVDAKGYFAQPLALLNIEEVQVQNLPNIYGDNSEDYPDFADDASMASILDLSRATELNKLVVTEGVYSDLENGEVASGPLTLTGIRNGAETTLDGGFTQNVTLNYGEMQGDGVNLVFNNLDLNATLNVAHNSETLNIEATGGNNYVGAPNFGGELNVMNISGGAHLFIEGDLEASFRDGTPVTIDASENTGGVTLALTGSEEVTFNGSQADDRVNLTATTSVVLEGNGGDNVYDVDAETATITVLDGNNQLNIVATDATVTAGDGDNTVTAEDATTVVVATGNGNNTISTDDSDSVTITTGTGDDTISSLNSDSVIITSEGGDNTIDVIADEMAITTGDGNDTISVSGVTDDDIGGDGFYMALVNITTGAGDDTVVLGSGVSITAGQIVDVGITALEGSSISGENITLRVEGPSDLRAAELEGISNVVLNYDVSDALTDDNTGTYEVAPALTLTDAQFLAIGAENFSVEGAAFDTYSQLKIIVTESTSLTDLGVDSLPAGLDLQLELRDGVTLEMTAEQLHTKVAPQGVTLAGDNNTDQASGKVLITDAGVDFDPFNTNDGVRTTIDGEVYYGGSLSKDFWAAGADDSDGIQQGEWGSNVKLDAALNGYNRPADEPSYSRIVIDTDTQGGDLGPFSSYHTYLRMVGESDLTFTPVEGGRDEWGAPIQGGSAIELGVGGEDFIIDFSSVTGEVQNLTIARFEDAAEIYGNGTRLNVELSGDVGSDDAGLVSRGVETYVVTNLEDAPDADAPGAGQEADFYTCETTQDLKTLGLRGNYGNTINFENTERGVEFLMEVAYSKANGYSVGTLNGVFARPGAAAVVNVVGIDALPAGEVQTVDGITLENAATATVNVEGGNTVIESLTDGTTDVELEELTLTADADLSITDALTDGINTIDASGVAGDLALSTAVASAEAEDFVFTGSTGTTELTMTASFIASEDSVLSSAGELNVVVDNGTDEAVGTGIIVDLTDADVSGVESLSVGAGDTVNLTVAKAYEIGPENITGADATARLQLSDLGEEPFNLDDFGIDTIVVDTIEVIDQPVVTLHPDTDLTGVLTLQVNEGTVLNLTAAQFQQLTNAGAIEGVGSPATTDFTVNITDLTQADVAESGLDLTGVTADNVTLTLAESVELSSDSDLSVDGGNLTVNIGDDLTLILSDIEDADGVSFVGGSESTLQFTDADHSLFDGIDASGFDISYLRVLNALVDGANVDLMFSGLPGSVTKVIYNGNGWAGTLDQTVTIEEATTVDGHLVFNPPAIDTEIANFTLNLQGGAVISDNLRLSTNPKFVDNNDDGTYQSGTDTDLMRGYLQSLTINTTGTAENPLNGDTANIIKGAIDPTGVAPLSADNNLLNVTITGDQALIVEGGIVFKSVTGDDDFTANDNYEAVATLTVDTSADVTLGALDISDDDVDSLEVSNTGTGTLAVTIDASLIDQAVGNTDALSFTGGNIELTVEGTVDLSDDDISGVSQITIAEDANVTLTQVQYDALGAANVVNGTTDAVSNEDEVLNLVDVSEAPFDATALAEGIEVNLFLVDGDITLDPTTDLTDVDSITVATDGSLTLTAEQFLQMEGNGTITGDVTITGLTQAQVDASVNLSGITGSITIETAESINLPSENTITDASGTVLGADPTDVEFVLGDNQTLGLGDVLQLSDRVVAQDTTPNDGIWEVVADGIGLTVTGGTDTAVELQFINGFGPYDTFDAGNLSVETLRVINDLVNDRDVELLQDIASDVAVVIYTSLDDLPGYVRSIDRLVTVEEGTTVDGFLVFNDYQDDSEVVTLGVTLEGDATINGNLRLSTVDKDADLVARYFDTLTINSVGTDVNTITGNITPLTITPDTLENRLLNVIVNAEQDFVVGGDIVFNGLGTDEDTASLTLTGDADVTVEQLDVSDNDIATLNIANDGTGTFTATGASPALFDEGNGDTTANLETLNLSGTGDMVFGSNDDVTSEWGISAAGLSTIDASGLSGDLELGEVRDIDSANFAFTAGSGVTTLTLTDSALTADVNADPADTGWSFDFTNAAVGSEFHLDAAFEAAGGTTPDFGPLNIDLGANTTLYIDESMDLSDLDLSITQTLDIVLADGVELTLSADQANNLSIQGGQGSIVNLVELQNDVVYDFSNIDPAVAGTILTLAENDVTVEEATNLGDFAIQLQANADEFAADGQTIRFNTAAQAERDIIVTGADAGAVGNSTNVIWLFEDQPAQAIDTSGYFSAVQGEEYNVGRLWVYDALADGVNVEDLYTVLSNDIIVRIANQEEIDAIPGLPTADNVSRAVEIEAFTTLDTGLTFNALEDVSDPNDEILQFIQNLDITIGGQVELGDLTLDNVIGEATANAQDFDTLTINSRAANTIDHYLLPEGFNGDASQLPNVTNTIGDIASGPGREQLFNVEIDTGVEQTGAIGDDGAALEINSIAFTGTADVTLTVDGFYATTVVDALDFTDASLTQTDATTGDTEINVFINGGGELDMPTGAIEFDSEEANTTVNLTIDGNVSVDAKTLTLSANIDAVNLVNSSTGTVNITGGSPAISGASLETLTLDAANGDIIIGSEDDADATNAFDGISAQNLETLTVTGTESVAVALDAISGDSFTYTGTANSVVLLDNVTLNTDGDWSFNLGAGQMTITGAADFSNPANLAVSTGGIGGRVLIVDEVDLRALDSLVVSGEGEFVLGTGEGENAVSGTLRLTAAQLDALLVSITKAGDQEALGTLIVHGEGDLTALSIAEADELVLEDDATISKVQFDSFYTNGEEGEADVVAITKGTNALTLALVEDDDISELDTSLVDVIAPAHGEIVTLSVEQTVKLAPEVVDDPATTEVDEGYSYIYNLNDTWANLSDPANLDVVLGAGEYDISDIDALTTEDLEGITAQQAAILAGAANVDSLTVTYTVEDDWAGWQQLIADATADPADAGAEAAMQALLAGEFTYEITDLASVDFEAPAISVLEAAVLTGADSYADEAYAISDDASAIFVDDTTTTYVSNTFGSDIGIGALLEGATGVTAQNLTVAQQGVLEGNSNIGLTEYTLADDFTNLGANAGVVSGAESYTISDIDELDFTDGAVTPGPISAAEAILLSGAENFDAATNVYDVEDNATGLFDANDWNAGVEAALDGANDIVVTGTLNATEGWRFSEVTNAGDKSYNVVDTAAQLYDRIDTLGADFSEADSITHNDVAIANNTKATGTDGVVDTFVFVETSVENVAITNFEAGDGTANDGVFDVLDFSTLLTTATLGEYAQLDGSADNEVADNGGEDILVFTTALATPTDAANVAGAFGVSGTFESAGAAVDFGTGDEKLFVFSNGTDAEIWHWADAATVDGVVEEGELTQIATLDGFADIQSGNFVEDNFGINIA